MVYVAILDRIVIRASNDCCDSECDVAAVVVVVVVVVVAAADVTVGVVLATWDTVFVLAAEDCVVDFVLLHSSEVFLAVLD